MADHPDIKANFSFLDRFFPFFFSIDDTGGLVSMGRSLKKVLGWDGEPVKYSQLLRIRFPYNFDFDYEAFVKAVGKIMVVDIINRKSQLKGEFVLMDDHPRELIFVGSLLLNPDEQLNSMQLSLGDFPSNDNSSTLLFSLMAQQSTLKEVTGLSQQLQQQSQELLEANQELMQYTHAVSHDLKTPLRTIKSFMQLLNRSFDELTPQQEEYISFILKGASRMGQLIEDLSVHSGIRDRPVQMEEVDMQDLLNEVVLGLIHELEAVNGQIEMSDLPVIRGDRNRLYQLFINLFQNSLKYRSEKNPAIQVCAEKKEQYWEFSVKDNGIGIEKPFQVVIFKPFKRLHNYSNIEGSGLGLAICKKIVEQHFGEITVESEPGCGATFIIRLPAAAMG